LDGTDAALPILAKAYARGEWLLSAPDYFYLPEHVSDDPEWLAFWQQPKLAELIRLRRDNHSAENIGLWRERE